MAGLPVLVKICYENPTPRMALSLGDTTFVFRRSEKRGKALKLFLPGRITGETFCTFSVLFDGSILLTKAFNGLPEIFINGNRVPADTPIGLYSRDAIILGSLEYAYILDLDSEENENWYDEQKKTLDHVASEVLLGGDLDYRFEDYNQQALTIGVERVQSILGISIFSFQAQELVEWVRWLGLSASHIVKIDETQRKVDLLIRTTIALVNVQNAVQLEGGHNFHSTCGMSFESSILHSYGMNGIDGEQKSLRLVALEGVVLFAQAIERILVQMTQLKDVNEGGNLNKSTENPDENAVKSRGFYGGYGPAAGVDFSAINDLYAPFTKAAGSSSSSMVENESGGNAMNTLVENKDGGGNGHIVRDRSYDDDMSVNMSVYSVSSPTPSRGGTGKVRPSNTTERDRSGTVTSTTSSNLKQSSSPPAMGSTMLPPVIPYRDLTAAIVRGCFHLLLSGGKKRQATKKWVLMCSELLLPLCLFVDTIDIGESDCRNVLSSNQSSHLRTVGSTDTNTNTTDVRLLSRNIPSSSSSSGSGSSSTGTSDTNQENNRVKHALSDIENAFAEVLLPYWSAPQCKQSRLVLEQVITASIQCIILLSVRHIFSRRLDGKIRTPIGRTTMAKTTTTNTASSMTVSSMLGTIKLLIFYSPPPPPPLRFPPLHPI